MRFCDNPNMHQLIQKNVNVIRRLYNLSKSRKTRPISNTVHPLCQIFSDYSQRLNWSNQYEKNDQISDENDDSLLWGYFEGVGQQFSHCAHPLHNIIQKKLVHLREASPNSYNNFLESKSWMKIPRFKILGSKSRHAILRRMPSLINQAGPWFLKSKASKGSKERASLLNYCIPLW